MTDRTDPRVRHPIRRRLTLVGTVQGVGFRPFVHRLAGARGLTGWVGNQGGRVTLEIQGEGNDVDGFIQEMTSQPPSGARVESCSQQTLPVREAERGFAIAESFTGEAGCPSLAPDSAPCPDCLREMRDPADRRFHYPFITCAVCGPRYTIAQELPHDRSRTTLACFEICPECARQYADPADRRFHAQGICCPACGPRVWLVRAGGEARPPPGPPAGDPAEAVLAASELLQRGEVVAIKGVGGFLLAADASSTRAVDRIREIKRRKSKPLALMVPDLEAARRLVHLDEQAQALLASPAAPIVLAPARAAHGLAPGIAPGLGDLGVMLPGSPLHHLLLSEQPAALVMTSANQPAEPIIINNRTACRQLPVDAFLLHDRDILLPTDDSVVRTAPRAAAPGSPSLLRAEGSGVRAGAAVAFVRRARGYVPGALEAGFLPRRSVLALGAELKATVTTLQQGRLVVGRHLGDLDDARTERAFRREVGRVLGFERLKPERVAVDLHPDLASTLLGEQLAASAALVRVQHHHAHLCAVMVEHGIAPERRVTGIILDGVGLGDDGTIWGGEVLSGGYGGFQRVAWLRPVPQPGGDRAAREPDRMSTSLLLDAGLGGAGVAGYKEDIAGICGSRAVSPLTSSAGRLFDGAAAILGLAPQLQSYQGEAAALLEAAAEPGCGDGYPLPLRGSELDTRELTAALVGDRSPTPARAARFHNALADALARAALAAGNDTVALGGGCMVNRVLLARLQERLSAEGLTVIRPLALPAGDGGLSAGQAAVAACADGR